MLTAGDRVTPVGWVLPSPKPVGIILEVDTSSAVYRVVVIEWEDGHTSRLAESVVEKTKDQLPTSGYLPGKGRVRVLSYEGNGMFFVLTNRDERVLVHRDRLKFTRGSRA